jgi:hypothetical protein
MMVDMNLASFKIFMSILFTVIVLYVCVMCFGVGVCAHARTLFNDAGSSSEYIAPTSRMVSER